MRYINRYDGMLYEPDGTMVPDNEEEYYEELDRQKEKLKLQKKAAA